MLDLIQRAKIVREKEHDPLQTFVFFIIAAGRKERNAMLAKFPAYSGQGFYTNNIMIRFIDLDAKDISVARGFTALHCFVSDANKLKAPQFVFDAVAMAMQRTAQALDVSVATLITNIDVFKD